VDQNDWAKYEMHVVRELTRLADRLDEQQNSLSTERIRIAEMLVRFDSTDSALKLHAKEMERRLEGLNQLREEVVRDRELLLRREIYDEKTKSCDSLFVSLGTRITKIETRAITWTAAIAMFFVLVNLLFKYLL